MRKHDDCKSCNHESTFGCEQTLSELDFEKSIFGCAVYGDLNKLAGMVAKKGARCVNDQDPNGYTCLHYAARHNRLDICKYLIENGAQVNVKTNSSESTPLHRACYIGGFEIVELLVSRGARVTDQDCDGKTALHKSVERLVESTDTHRFIKCIRILVSKDPTLVNLKDSSGKTPLDICQNLLEIIK